MDPKTPELASPSVAGAPVAVDAPAVLDYGPPPRRPRLGPAGLLALATLVVPPLGAVLLLANARQWADPLRQSPWGPALAVAAFSVVGGFALLPTVALSIFAGWAFGFALGLPTAVLGFVGAAAVCYAVARRAAGRGVLDAVEADPRWRAVHAAILGGGEGRTFLIVALLRLPVVPPFGATTVALAALKVRVRPFLLGTAVGVVPRTAGYVLLASRMTDLNFAAGDDWAMLAVWGAVTVAVIGTITVLGRRALRRLTAEARAVE